MRGRYQTHLNADIRLHVSTSKYFCSRGADLVSSFPSVSNRNAACSFKVAPGSAFLTKTSKTRADIRAPSRRRPLPGHRAGGEAAERHWNHSSQINSNSTESENEYNGQNSNGFTSSCFRKIRSAGNNGDVNIRK